MFMQAKVLSGKKDTRTVGPNGSEHYLKNLMITVLVANVGTFLKGFKYVRVRAGLDHEWGDDVGAGEKVQQKIQHCLQVLKNSSKAQAHSLRS